jgi:hypothetical protein
MSMLKRLGRLFTIKTRWEAWAVIWAISLGAVERGKAYLQVYHGAVGWMFFLACTAVVFIAGPKLLDSVRPLPQPSPAPLPRRPRHGFRRPVSRSRPRSFHRNGGSGSPPSLRRS